jgi:DNA-binding winged helix-turn-helix (wHTH) protein/TolB-like protein/Tfp pilus assembly protein PilF
MTNGLQSQIYEFGGFRLNTANRVLLRNADEIIPLTPKIFDTLLYLVRNNGKVIGKDELMHEIWTDTIVEENNLNKNISVLRRVLGEKPGEHRFIVTIPGQGYKFVADVREKSEADSGLTGEVPSEVRISDERIQIEDQTETGNLKSEINKDRKTKPGRRKNRLWLAAAFGMFGVGLILLGFYDWRKNEKPVEVTPFKTIAVLPFKPLVAENRDEALEMGMADALISKLSGDEAIIVRPLSSVRRYASLEQDSLTAGRELGTEAILEGSIQTSGGRIRISARLIQTSAGKQLWAGQFDEKFTDIFIVQDSISERVATALKIRLGGRAKKRSTENVEAYQLYMKGRFHVLKAIKPETETGVSYFQQAIAADPHYALAYAGLADAYRGLTVGGEMPSAEFMPKAKAAANKAIEIDDTLAEAHAILGHITFLYDWDWKESENQYKRALELDPNSADALQFYAHFLSNTGRHAEALPKIKRARELDPLNLRINALEGLFLLHAGQTDEAITKLRKTLELDPNSRLANMFAARAYSEKGMFAEAVTATRKARELSNVSSEPIAFGVYALAKSGKVTEARAALDELLKLSNNRYVPPYHIALAYNALGEREKALDYLEKGFADQDVRMVFLRVEPKWNNLHSEPRFIDLIKRMRLEGSVAANAFPAIIPPLAQLSLIGNHTLETNFQPIQVASL